MYFKELGNWMADKRLENTFIIITITIMIMSQLPCILHKFSISKLFFPCNCILFLAYVCFGKYKINTFIIQTLSVLRHVNSCLSQDPEH